MPNKYSHAFVLSNYESHGIIGFDRSQSSKSSSYSRPRQSSVNPPKPNTSSSKTGHASSSSKQPERLWLGSPTPLSTTPERPPLHRRSSSIETQIYAPIWSPTPPPARNWVDTDGLEQEAQRHTDSPSTSVQNLAVLSESPLDKGTVRLLEPKNASADSRQPPKIEKQPTQTPASSKPTIQGTGESSKRPSPAPQQLSTHSPKSSMRHNSAVAVRGQEYTSPNTHPSRTAPVARYRPSDGLEGSAQPLHNPYGKLPLAARAFLPERPPSPPATPISGRSFSLQMQMSKLDLPPPQPPVPKPSMGRDPPEPSSGRRPSMATKSPGQNAPSRPKPFPHPESPTGTTFSIATRASSFDGASFSAFDSGTFSMPAKEFDNDSADLQHSRKPSHMPSLLFPDDDADLESLPSTIDFDALPWCNHNIGPAIFRDGELNVQDIPLSSPALTRASSFDSAAPPPISLDRRMPSIFAEDPLPAVLAKPTKPAIPAMPPTASVPKTPKKPKASIASLSFFRSAPKAILYSQTVPGKPPIPISVSRTAVPSIPALFPDYKGQFPPPQQQKKDGPPNSRQSRATNIQSQQKRGRSVPPRPSSRRRSWFKTDQLDKAFGMMQPDERRGLD